MYFRVYIYFIFWYRNTVSNVKHYMLNTTYTYIAIYCIYSMLWTNHYYFNYYYVIRFKWKTNRF